MMTKSESKTKAVTNKSLEDLKEMMGEVLEGSHGHTLNKDELQALKNLRLAIGVIRQWSGKKTDQLQIQQLEVLLNTAIASPTSSYGTPYSQLKGTMNIAQPQVTRGVQLWRDLEFLVDEIDEADRRHRNVRMLNTGLNKLKHLAQVLRGEY